MENQIMKPFEMQAVDREDFISQIHHEYLEKGISPIFDMFCLEAGDHWRAISSRCCPLAVLIAGEEIPKSDDPFEPSVWTALERKLGWSNGELFSFVQGVDGKPFELLVDLPELRSAHELGGIVRRAFV